MDSSAPPGSSPTRNLSILQGWETILLPSPPARIPVPASGPRPASGSPSQTLPQPPEGAVETADLRSSLRNFHPASPQYGISPHSWAGHSRPSWVLCQPAPGLLCPRMSCSLANMLHPCLVLPTAMPSLTLSHLPGKPSLSPPLLILHLRILHLTSSRSCPSLLLQTRSRSFALSC